MHTYICIWVGILSVDFNLDQWRGESYQPIHACLSAVFSVCVDPCGQSCVCVLCVCVFMHVCLSGIHAHPCHWLNLGTWSHSSLILIGLLDSATSNTYTVDAVKNLFIQLSPPHYLTFDCSRKWGIR